VHFQNGRSLTNNLGGWIRGAKDDYDAWGDVVQDPRWSYNGFLKYFRKIEKHHSPGADPEQHGFHGPANIRNISTSGCTYPLREIVKRVWEELGLQEVKDPNAGNPIGFGEMNDNRQNDGFRQLASDIFPLNGVKVLTDTIVKRVVIVEHGENKIATGVELMDGTIIKSNKEVIVSAGAYRTPQVLLLSGIGPEEELSKLGIKQNINLPVGKNLHDHLGVMQWYHNPFPTRTKLTV
jgi:choline dehydrogenase-like flavoprotein